MFNYEQLCEIILDIASDNKCPLSDRDIEELERNITQKPTLCIDIENNLLESSLHRLTSPLSFDTSLIECDFYKHHEDTFRPLLEFLRGEAISFLSYSMMGDIARMESDTESGYPDFDSVEKPIHSHDITDKSGGMNAKSAIVSGTIRDSDSQPSFAGVFKTESKTSDNKKRKLPSNSTPTEKIRLNATRDQASKKRKIGSADKAQTPETEPLQKDIVQYDQIMPSNIISKIDKHRVLLPFSFLVFWRINGWITSDEMKTMMQKFEK